MPNQKLKKKLQDKCWYWVCYADGLKEKDKIKYANAMMEDILKLFETKIQKDRAQH